MKPVVFSRLQYAVFFLLLLPVYIFGLFVPLMDNDSAHHANIALHMYLTGDYVNLIDHGKDYLDKPHLHFWLAAWSYHVFGATGFAYKLPTFLFTLLGTYSTYRLGRILYNSEVGRLAALIVASCFAYILANNDVRMDGILTASIIFATWQLVAWVQNKKFINALGAALGLALGFCTKGHIGVFTPVAGAFFYILYTRNWRSFYHPQLLVLVLSFCLFIAPVVYCYYLQYDLHPEKIIRGKSGRSGVAFILWKQNFERFQGDSFGADAKNDYLFFFHSFLWAFAPWSVLTYVAFFNRVKNLRFKRQEWITPGTIALMVVMITFSGFKLPHYLNIIFPVSAILCASYLVDQGEKRKNLRGLLLTQIIICTVCLVVAGVINVWAFPVNSLLVVLGFVILLLVLILVLRLLITQLQKLVAASVVTAALVFYLLNTNFYPQLLRYQAGNEMAFGERDKLNPRQVFFWPDIYSSSYNFYTGELRKEFTDDALKLPTPVWIMTDAGRLPDIQKRFTVTDSIAYTDYEITRMQLPFINPATRQKELGKMIAVRVK